MENVANIEFNLDRLLSERGLNVRQASKLCSLSYPTTYAIARNQQARVDLRTLAHLSAGLGVSIESLFRKKPSPFAEGEGSCAPGTTPEVQEPQATTTSPGKT